MDVNKLRIIAASAVCLIEGRVAVEHGGRQFTMAEPLSFFIAPRKDRPLPVAPVDPRQLQQWAAETDTRRAAAARAAAGAITWTRRSRRTIIGAMHRANHVS